ncbi:MAG: hypothetical protein JOY61_08730 [Chloroflexi bacterium]|nr:hypothetical protein [Chloroflexota bacterium]
MTQPGLPPRGQLASDADQPPRGLTVEDVWREVQALRRDLDQHREAYLVHGRSVR